MPTLSLALSAMATRFEIVLHGDKPASLRAAGEEALEEIERLEAHLSLFRRSSEITHLNARAAKEPVRVSPPLFALLQHAQELNQETDGAFDITISPLLHCWGFRDGSGHLPDPEALTAARAKVGMSLVQLEPKDFTVRFLREGVTLDLGALGKGYAVERAAEILREAGVTSALIHGGTSSVEAIGHPPDTASWKIGIANPLLPPPSFPREEAQAEDVQKAEADNHLLSTIELTDEAMSVSGIHGKFFKADGETFGHVIDPRTGQPANRAVLAVVVLPSATESDALSTALLTLGPESHEKISKLRPGMKTLVASETAGKLSVQAKGIAVPPLALISGY